MWQRWWWVVTGFCAVVVLFVYTIRWQFAGREQLTVLDRSVRADRIQKLCYDVSSYRDVYGHYPRSICRDRLGQPLSSWRLAIRMFVEQIGEVPEERTDLPWYAPENLLWLHAGYAQCFVFTEAFGPARPNVAAVIGPRTAFGDETSSRTTVPGDTIILVETAALNIFWPEPGDLDVRDMSPSMVHGVDGQGVHIAFADGEVWYLDHRVPFSVLNRFFVVEGASTRNREKELSPYRKDK
jgi:hypothetical protein